MNGPLVFVDTETTGLDWVNDDPWEFAGIRVDDDGRETVLHGFIEHAQWKVDRLPEKYQADRNARFDHLTAWTRQDAARKIEAFCSGAHLVAAGAAFDAGILTALLRGWRLEPSWHHHLIDVETLTVGYLLGNANQRSSEGLPPRPWSSDALAASIGVEPPAPGERHTALGDARWVQRWFYKVTGGAW